MRQKVALAGALVHDPKLIILDEPLTGLDAGTARQVKNVLRERVSAGGTVIMTTHILEVAERMADRIGVDRRRAASSPKVRSTICAVRPEKPRQASKTLFSRWSPKKWPPRESASVSDVAGRPRIPPRLARLGLPDDCGRPQRVRVPPSIALICLCSLHACLRILDRGLAMPNASIPTRRRLVGITGLAVAVLVAAFVAGDGIRDPARSIRVLISISSSRRPLAREKCSRCAWAALPVPP